MKPKIATICSHSALQIFHGAKLEGLETIGICTPDRREFYNSMPRARPDEFIMVNSFKEILEEEIQERLKDNNAVIIPHGSFVAYVGAENLIEDFKVPLFGSKESLKWEADRKKEREWLKAADINVPEIYKNPEEIDSRVIVKYDGAKGGKGFFTASSKQEFDSKIDENKDYMIQEFVDGNRYYPHYFYSILDDELEILGLDRRDEANIDEIHRSNAAEPSFVVVGNKPLAVRESLLPKLYEVGKRLVEVSQEKFPPGIFGPFCIEGIIRDNLEFVAFEISGRIVAGTNLYPNGSPYTYYYYNKPMSTGRRIALEIKKAWKTGQLDKVTC